MSEVPAGGFDMFDLKTIPADAVPEAMEKAERYRLLNEPRDAESICRDVLRVEPDHQGALVALILTLTDQFGKGLRVSVSHARELLPRLENDYERAYYDGLICERWGKAQFGDGAPGYVIYDWLRQAMEHFQKAEAIRPASDADAILRWNACARMIKRNEQVRPRPEDAVTDLHQDDVPLSR
jgi:hypothetical protein